MSCSQVLPNNVTPPNFTKRIATKPQNSRKFFSSKVSRDMVLYYAWLVCRFDIAFQCISTKPYLITGNLAAIKFGETVRIGYIYILAILNFGEFHIALPRARDPSTAYFPILGCIVIVGVNLALSPSPGQRTRLTWSLARSNSFVEREEAPHMDNVGTTGRSFR